MITGFYLALFGLVFWYLVYLFKRFILGKSKNEIRLQDLQDEEINLITSSNIFKSKAKKENQLKEIRDEIEFLNSEVSQNEHKTNTNDTSITKAVYNHVKDLSCEIKPIINEYKEKHSNSNFNSQSISNTYSNISDNTIELNEDEIYEKIMLEIEEDKKVKSTWARALSQSDGNKEKAESLYIKLRVDILIQEERNRLNEEKLQQEEIIRFQNKKLEAGKAEEQNVFNQEKLEQEEISKLENDKTLKLVLRIILIILGLFFAYDIIMNK